MALGWRDRSCSPVCPSASHSAYANPAAFGMQCVIPGEGFERPCNVTEGPATSKHHFPYATSSTHQFFLEQFTQNQQP